MSILNQNLLTLDFWQDKVAGSKIVGVELPDVLIRIIGIVDLISLPVLTYTTVIKVKRNKT